MSLTCKVGNNVINTFEFEKEQIRKWSNKGILKCPMCEGKMVYKHGEYKIPHFAHECSCEFESQLIYNQPESEEHMIGKRNIYNWLKTQEGIENLRLEAWIPETKQRPDVYFEKDGVRYVIEYQCTPIATKYAERHRLYEFAGIEDIWILGTEKFLDCRDITKSLNGLSIDMSTKTIERELMDSKYGLKYLINKCILKPNIKSMIKITDVVKYRLNFCKLKIDNHNYENIIKKENSESEINDLLKTLYNLEKFKTNVDARREIRLEIEQRRYNLYSIRRFINNMNRYGIASELKNNEFIYFMDKNNIKHKIYFIMRRTFKSGLDIDNEIKRINSQNTNNNFIIKHVVVDKNTEVLFEKSTTSYKFDKNKLYINSIGWINILKYENKWFFAERYVEYNLYEYKSGKFEDNLNPNIQDSYFYKSLNYNKRLLIVDDFYKKPVGTKLFVKRPIRYEEDVIVLLNEIKSKEISQIILPLNKDRFGKPIRLLKYELDEIKELFNSVGYNNVDIYWG